MEFLLNPNVAYVALVVGILLGLMALVTPGTGFFEIGALFAFALAGYGAYNLGLNVWALVPLALALVPFLYALRSARWRLPLLTASILLVIGGSIFLFPGEDGSLVGVNPFLAATVSLLYGGIFWIAVDRTLVAMSKPVVHNPQSLIGQIGEARTEIKDEGSVQVGGELWSARSEHPIPTGSAVRVVGMEGFVLIVESVIK